MENYIEKFTNDLFGDKTNITKEDFKKWLTDNEWKISSEYEKSCQMQDLLRELEFRGYDTEQINEKLLDNILYTYKDKLGDSEEWRYILNAVINDYAEDLRKYSY